MELKELIKKIRKYRKTIAASLVVGLIIGILSYYIPPKYVTRGSLYVKRDTDQSTDFFTYEGYYAGQAAQAYTNSLVAIIESQDIKKTVLEELNIPVTGRNLRKLGNAITVKKTGPQVIEISVKEKNRELSSEVWKIITKTTIDTSRVLNESSDNNLSVNTISSEPLIEETYRSMYTFAFAGIIIGISVGFLIVSIKEYFKD